MKKIYYEINSEIAKKRLFGLSICMINRTQILVDFLGLFPY